MAINTEIQRIQTAKSDIKTAIEAKDVVVPNDALISDYAQYVAAIGGGKKIIEGVEIDPTATYTGEFKLIGWVEKVEVPEGFSSIGGYTFDAAKKLVSVILPSTITSIGSYAFQACPLLTSVTIYSTTPPTGGFGMFDGSNSAQIYVPAESVETYKAADKWSNYAGRIQAIPSTE